MATGSEGAARPEVERQADDERPVGRGQTIGAVCQALRQEFPDISISKIRYLEDQRLLTPGRTAGGYRVYSPADVERLRAILRMQRDEFLPLRVIRQELAAGRGTSGAPSGDGASSDASGGREEHGRPTSVSVHHRGDFHREQDVLREARADDRLLRDLTDYGLITGRSGSDGRLFDDAEREIVIVAAALSRWGIGARHLRTFRSSSDREAGLLQQLLGPALRSRNPERRKEAVDALDDLAVTVSRLSHLLLVRDLRRLTD